MFLDGMGDQLSGLQEDKAGREDHAQGYPLDGVEEIAQEDVEETGLTEEGEEKLNGAGGGQGEGEGVAGVMAVRELADEDQGDERCGDGRVEGDGMEADGIRRDSDAPGEGGGEAGVTAFGEVAEGEECPDQRGAGRPGVQRGEKREMAEAEIDSRDDRGEEKAGGSERRHHEQKDGVGAETLQVGEDQEKAREDKGREDGEEAGVPDRFGIQADGDGGAKTEGERGHEANCSEDAEGGKEEMTGVKEVGVHVRSSCYRVSGRQKTDPLGRTSKRW
jgi:hypothetical protein